MRRSFLRWIVFRQGSASVFLKLFGSIFLAIGEEVLGKLTVIGRKRSKQAVQVSRRWRLKVDRREVSGDPFPFSGSGSDEALKDNTCYTRVIHVLNLIFQLWAHLGLNVF